jgi:hypothetical protein
MPGCRSAISSVIASVALTGLTGSCKPPSQERERAPELVVARIEVTAPRTVFTAVGESMQIVAVALDVSGVPVANASITWTSASSSIVEVSSSGLATARANGTARVRAASGGTTGELELRVEQGVATVTITGTPTAVHAIGATIRLQATAADARGNPVAGVPISWSSGNAAVALVDAVGTVTTTGTGMADIVASAGGVSGSWRLEVATVVFSPVDPYLATPAAGRLWEVPVLIIAYLPTADGVNVDVRKNPGFYGPDPLTLREAEDRILDIVKRKKMALEQGSRYRGYKDPTALPSIGYRIVGHVIVYELTPASAKRQGNDALSPYHADFLRIFQRLEVQRYVDVLGVRQVWFVSSGFDAGYPSYNPAIHNPQDFRFYWESNMSSPLTGDISNSDRDPSDLPVYGHSYIVFGINYRRSQAEAIHNVGHQLEHMLSHVNGLEGNTDLFWKQFVGQNAQGQFITGRAGWTHMPPNTTVDYDYLNPTLVNSDIEDWTPNASGLTKPANMNTWGGLTYPWPGASDFPQRVESQWYTYWFQNFPGRGNQIRRGSDWLTNWWAFFGDWDAAITSGLRLSGSTPAATVGTGSIAIAGALNRVLGSASFVQVCVEPTRTQAKPR